MMNTRNYYCTVIVSLFFFASDFLKTLLIVTMIFVFASVEFSFRNDNIYFSCRTLLTLFEEDNFFKKKMSCVYEKNHSFRNNFFFSEPPITDDVSHAFFLFIRCYKCSVLFVSASSFFPIEKEKKTFRSVLKKCVLC